MSLTWPLSDGVRRAGLRLRLVGAGAVLTVLAWRFGTGPFADAWKVTTWPAVLAALVATALATLAAAWRWRVVAHALGVPLTRRGAVAAYYRSQFLNSTLPGGVLGDAHRGVRHGRAVGDLGVGVRAVVWDRVSGQVVQTGAMLLAVALLPTSLGALAPVAVAALLAVALVGWLLARQRRVAAFVADDLRALRRPRVAGRIALASCCSIAGHALVFLLAVRAVGVDAPLSLLAPTSLVVMLGSALPLNVAGWGPREGVTTWVFAFTGLGAPAGLTVSIVYGVLAAAATAPGAVVLLVDAVARRRRARLQPVRTPADEPAQRPLEACRG